MPASPPSTAAPAMPVPAVSRVRSSSASSASRATSGASGRGTWPLWPSRPTSWGTARGQARGGRAPGWAIARAASCTAAARQCATSPAAARKPAAKASPAPGGVDDRAPGCAGTDRTAVPSDHTAPAGAALDDRVPAAHAPAPAPRPPRLGEPVSTRGLVGVGEQQHVRRRRRSRNASAPSAASGAAEAASTAIDQPRVARHAPAPPARTAGEPASEQRVARTRRASRPRPAARPTSAGAALAPADGIIVRSPSGSTSTMHVPVGRPGSTLTAVADPGRGELVHGPRGRARRRRPGRRTSPRRRRRPATRRRWPPRRRRGRRSGPACPSPGARGPGSCASTSTIRSPTQTTRITDPRRVRRRRPAPASRALRQHQGDVGGQRGAVRLAVEEVEQERRDVLAVHAGGVGGGQPGRQRAVVQRRGPARRPARSGWPAPARSRRCPGRPARAAPPRPRAASVTVQYSPWPESRR